MATAIAKSSRSKKIHRINISHKAPTTSSKPSTKQQIVIEEAKQEPAPQHPATTQSLAPPSKTTPSLSAARLSSDPASTSSAGTNTATPQPATKYQRINPAARVTKEDSHKPVAITVQSNISSSRQVNGSTHQHQAPPPVASSTELLPGILESIIQTKLTAHSVAYLYLR
jgi:hypothetical protein